MEKRKELKDGPVSGTVKGTYEDPREDPGSERRAEYGDPAADILSFFNSERRDIRSFSPLILAFVGDNVFDLIIRTLLAENSSSPAGIMHKIKSSMVKASAQSQMADRIMHLLTEEELAVYKRGRNAKSHTVPKNADVTDYRKATGLEALFGYLFLEGNMERILELTREGCTELKRYIC